MQKGYGKNRDFWPKSWFIPEVIGYNGKQMCDLSNGAIFNDLERTPTPAFKVMPLLYAEYLRNGTGPMEY